MENSENVKTPETFMDRLLAEKEELTERFLKLESFLASEKAKEVDEKQLMLLRIQLLAMRTYNQCLWERLGLLSA